MFTIFRTFVLHDQAIFSLIINIIINNEIVRQVKHSCKMLLLTLSRCYLMKVESVNLFDTGKGKGERKREKRSKKS